MKIEIEKVLRALETNSSGLAKRLGVQPSQISLWRNEIVSIPARHLKKIEEILRKEKKDDSK